MKKHVTLFLCILLSLALMLTACGRNEQEANTSNANDDSAQGENGDGEEVKVNPNGTFPIVDEKVTLKIFAPDEPYIVDLETNDFTKWYEEKTNVHIEWEQVPTDSIAEKRNLVLASGEYPDIFMSSGITREDEILYGSQRIFIPLNDLIEEYGVETKKVFEYLDYMPEAITAPDGNIYGLPAVNECYHCMYPRKAWINQEWLDNLGLEYPETTDDLYEVLKAFKERDPNGNGEADEIPMSGANGGTETVHDFLIGSFIYNDGSDRLLVENGQVDFAANKPEFKEALKYINKLYSEGLIDQAAFTQDVQQFKQLGSNPENARIGVGVSFLWWTFLGPDAESPDERYKKYVPLSPLEGPEGVRLTSYNPYGFTSGAFVITNKCKYPEVAMRWADWLYTEEGSLRASIGREGEEWVWAEEGEIGINGKPAIWKRLSDEQGEFNWSWGNLGTTFRHNDWRLGQVASPDNPWEQEVRLYNVSKDYYSAYVPDEVYPPVYFNADEVSELGRLRTQINDYVNESIVRFITGDLNIETEWDAYVDELNNLELDKYLDMLQKAYDNQYK